MTEWLIFIIIIATLLVLDLGFFHKKDQIITTQQNIIASLFYFTVACLFAGYIFYHMGLEMAEQYITGFFIEKTLALDNIFIIAIVFEFFAIPPIYQHRILFWGILGVLVFRAIMIGIGSVLITKFSWILYILAVILIITGIKMLYYIAARPINITELYVYKLLQKYCNITPEIKGSNFFVRLNNKIYVTPLFAALVIIETMDIIFAVDSIPIIFAITNNSYIVYTSNIFAILGLRSLFFCLAAVIEKFKYLKYSLALILIFIGLKIIISHFIPIPVYIPLSVTIALLLSGIVVSILKMRQQENRV